MKTLKQQLADKRAAREPGSGAGNRKSRRTVKHAAKNAPTTSKMMNLMLMPNEQVQTIIVQGTNSTLIPVPKGDHSYWAGISRMRKEMARAAAWNGARA